MIDPTNAYTSWDLLKLAGRVFLQEVRDWWRDGWIEAHNAAHDTCTHPRGKLRIDVQRCGYQCDQCGAFVGHISIVMDHGSYPACDLGAVRAAMTKYGHKPGEIRTFTVER